jgi:hypothetical protein
MHVDIDSTLEPLFGHQEGVLLGPNPHYRTSTSASFSCYRVASGSATNNWQCTTGGDNGLYWSEVIAKYGEGSN